MGGGRAKTWRSGILAGIAAGAMLLTSGCKIVSIKEDAALRERRAGHFDSASFVAKNWSGKFRPQIASKAVDANVLIAALTKNPDAAPKFGRQASEGADWTFVVKGEGTVVSTNDTSRAGAATLAIGNDQELRILTGPVLVSTALRDSLPELRFDDFSDQSAFAEVNRALNTRALAEVQHNRAILKVGSRISFIGSAQMREGGGALDLVPISLRAAKGI